MQRRIVLRRKHHRPRRSVAQHNHGAGTNYTARRRPVRLVWSAHFDRVEDAYIFEKQVQNWGRAMRIALIEGRYEDLPALAKSRR